MTIQLVSAVLTIYFLVLLLISYLTSKSDSNESFFIGDRKSPWYIVAFGMIGASLSGITFISIPGSVAKFSIELGLVPSDQFSYMQMVFGYFFGYIIVAFVLLPIYYKINLTSIYGYLKERFGSWSYKTGSAFFLLSRLTGASIRLLLVSSVLQLILFDEIGIPFELTVVTSVLLIWIYTNRGGIKTIIWTDTLQTFFMLAAVITTVYLIGDNLNLKEKTGFINEINQSGFSKVFYFENWHDSNYFWKHFLGGIFITIGMTGLDQDMMQKNLSCKNLKSAQLNMVSFAGVLIIVNLVFLVLGALLFMYFEQTGVGSNVLKVSNPRTDLLFAEIAKNGSLGVSVGVLFLLGLIAAAYSSADSALTSLTTSFSIDFLNIETKPIEKQPKIRKVAHLIMSLVLILIIIFLRRFSNDSAIWMLIKLAGFTYGPLIGLFFFGILTKRNLNDKLVPLVSVIVPIIVATIWYIHGQGKIRWLGTYEFGAELIIYNSLLSFGSLFLISKSKS
jgi:SSS family transporter|tara:strand:+ start:1189 stop:2700 length:1512 start_codon:yes stop_codon:yes gene_type:complete